MVARSCVINGRQLNEFKRLAPLHSRCIFRSEHIATNSCGKVNSRWSLARYSSVQIHRSIFGFLSDWLIATALQAVHVIGSRPDNIPQDAVSIRNQITSGLDRCFTFLDHCLPFRLVRCTVRSCKTSWHFLPESASCIRC